MNLRSRTASSHRLSRIILCQIQGRTHVGSTAGSSRSAWLTRSSYAAGRQAQASRGQTAKTSHFVLSGLNRRMRPYDDEEADLFLDEAHWSFMTAEQKICANTGFCTGLRNTLPGRVKETFKPFYRCGFSHQKCTDKNHVDRLCKNMTDDDQALLVLHSSKQESLKASSALIGKKRKEVTGTETRAYQKQCLRNAVFKSI